MEYPQTLMRYNHTNNSLLSSGNTKKSTTYEPRTEAISPAINDDILNSEDSTSKSTKDEQTLIVEKLKKVEAEILQTDLQIVRLRRQKDQLEQAANNANKDDDDQENVCDTKQLSIAKLVYHENRAKALRAHAKLDCIGGCNSDLPMYNQPTDNAIYHRNAATFNYSFKASLVNCFRMRLTNRLKLEGTISSEYDRRMEKWLKSIESEDFQPSKRIKDAKAREFFEKQFPELKKARESGERFSRVGQRVARSDAEVAELLDGITEREDQDKKVKSYAVIPPMLEEMRSRKPKFINTNGYVEDIIAEYKEYQILNTWTDEEKDIFRENYLQHPKDFGLISRMTSRKNVANCVQYYYLSKKNENYKQLLKRQQKRRTRSFVRPAQATPANTAVVESNNDSNNKGSTDKQPVDAIMIEGTNAPDQVEDKSSALLDSGGNADANDTSIGGSCNHPAPTCCICSCNFDETNQFRIVTKSNHQIYGIGLDSLKPGLKICYSCRFRHVKHPSFDDASMSSEIMDEEQFNDMMEVDTPVIKEDSKQITGSSFTETPKNIPPQPTSPVRISNLSDVPNDPDNGDASKGPKRTCVRDIIYQAIEMSFQKQETNESNDTQPKVESLRPDCVPPPVAPILTQNPLSSIPGSVYSIPHSNPCFAPVQMMNPRQQIVDEGSRIRQQQYQMQIRQQQHLQQQQHQVRQQHYPHLMHPQLNSAHSMPTQAQPMIVRHPNNSYTTTSPQPNILSPAMQPPPPPPHSLLTVVHSVPLPRLQSAQKPLTSAPNHLPASGPNAHPLNLCRKYSDPVFSPAEAVKQHGKTKPPIAHSGKIGPVSGSIDDGVLNLSAKHQSQTTPILQQGPLQPLQQIQVPTSYVLPIMVPTSQPHLTISKPSPNLLPMQTQHLTNTTAISPPVSVKQETPTNGDNSHEPNQRIPTPPGAGNVELPKELSPPKNIPSSSPPRINNDKMRSPNPIGSPTSPSEMVIDESADVASASDQDDDSEIK